MESEVIPDSAIVRDYVCRLCHSHLTMKWTEEEGSFVVCTGCGARENFVRRSTVELQQKREHIGRSTMRNHPLWCKLIPRLAVGARQSARELFDD